MIPALILCALALGAVAGFEFAVMLMNREVQRERERVRKARHAREVVLWDWHRGPVEVLLSEPSDN